MVATRVSAGAVVLWLCALLSAAPAAADCFDLDDESTEVVRGVIRAVPGVGDVSYRIGYSNSGFGHHMGAVEIEWMSAGAPVRQVLFHAMHDNPPVILARTAQGLAVRLQFCMREEDTCRRRTASYVYQPARRQFQAANATARELFSLGCQ